MAAHTFYEIRRRAFAALVPPERRRTGEFQAANGRFPPELGQSNCYAAMAGLGHDRIGTVALRPRGSESGITLAGAGLRWFIP